MKKQTKFVKRNPIVVIFVLLTVLAFIFRFAPTDSWFTKKPTENTTQAMSVNLPSGWTQSDNTPIALKIEKQVESDYQPTITLIKSTVLSTDSPKDYIDKLIAGAKSSLPSLKIVSDDRQDINGLYLATINSFYYQDNLKISVYQQIFVKHSQVSTITASYTGDFQDIKVDVDQIFQTITDSNFN